MTVVLVPGIGCAPWQFDRVAPGFAPEPVRRLELPGHGAEAAVVPVTLETVADRLAEQVPTGSVLVGHSTGGVAGLVLAARHPGLLRRLVLLDANLPVTEDALQRKASRAEAVLRPDWRRTLEASMRSSWGPHDAALGEDVVAGSSPPTPPPSARCGTPCWRSTRGRCWPGWTCRRSTSGPAGTSTSRCCAG